MNLASMRKPLYYGWIIAATLAVTQTISWGILYYSFSVFLTSFESDLHASRAEVTGAFSLALLCSGAIAVFVGRWIDRHGARGIGVDRQNARAGVRRGNDGDLLHGGRRNVGGIAAAAGDETRMLLAAAAGADVTEAVRAGGGSGHGVSPASRSAASATASTTC